MMLVGHDPDALETDLIMVQAAILCSHTGYLLLLMQGQQQQHAPSPGYCTGVILSTRTDQK